MRLQLFPGLDLDSYGRLLVDYGIRGVVIELYPSFTASERGERYSLQRFASRCACSAVTYASIASASRCRSGTRTNRPGSDQCPFSRSAASNRCITSPA